MSWMSSLVIGVMAVGAAPGGNPDAAGRVPEGTQATDRQIEMSVVVDAPRDEVFRLWTTVEGVNRFFGEEAEIEPEVGGAYEIYFLPRSHPESDLNSTRGAKLLWLEPPEGLAFEWSAPPFARELNVRPLPMWIEVALEPVPGRPHKTIVHVAHRGFGRSQTWDEVYGFFLRAWSRILYRLDLHLAQSDPAGGK